MPLKKYFEHQRDNFSLGSQLSIYVVQETSKNTLEEPAAADLILAAADVQPNQQAERVTSDARTSGTRSPAKTFLGRLNHGETPLEFELRPPGQMTGTDVPVGAKVLKALTGKQVIANGQAKVNINAVNAHSRAYTEIDITDAIADWAVGMGARFVSLNSGKSNQADGQLCLVTVATDIGGGSVRLRLEPGLVARPIVTGTKDQIQGVNCWYPDDTVDWNTTWTMYVLDGFDAAFLVGSSIGKKQLTIDAKSLLKLQGTVGFREAVRCSEDQIAGNGSTDTLATTDTTLKVGDARKFDVGARINLLQYTVSSGALVGTETKAIVTARNVVANTITVTRGASPRTATDLTIATSTQEVVETYNTTTTNKLKLAIDNRPAIVVSLTAGATTTAATIVTDINNALRDSEHYGQAPDVPYGGFDWSAVASVVATKVRLTSKAFGSQSRIQVLDEGTSASAHAVIFTGTFDIKAVDEIQIAPWSPGGSVSLDPIHGKDGWSSLDGNILKEVSTAVNFSNEEEWLEDVRNRTDLPEGFIPGLRRALDTTVQLPAYGWTGRLQYMARQDEVGFFHTQVGKAEGKSFAIIEPRVKANLPTVEGENRRTKSVGFAPEEDTAKGLKEIYIIQG